MTLYKLFVTDIVIKRCITCIHYTAGGRINGTCNIFKNIVEARLDPDKCGIRARYFEHKEWTIPVKKYD